MNRVHGVISSMFWLVLCVGCQSNSKVHVYHAVLEENKQSILTNELDALGIEYRLNNVIPKRVYDNPTLFYFPGDLTQSIVDEVTLLVNKLGFERLDTRVFNHDNHFYSQGNLGLYFPALASKQVAPNLLYTHDCSGHDSRVVLRAERQWREEGVLSTHNVSGGWQYEAPYLTLIYTGQYGRIQQAYREEHHQVMTLQGPKKATTYHVLGHREYPVKLFNCDLRVIYAQ
ncbi:hypothetical protein [Pseudoalteromonas sp. MMG005]|uniref:hypothetical protein n=1 Tax=Pseudoalteromonas sp. MMG005 TaxID=2822682 RepID=UPI001B39FE73|nr:hypothetical protein [Pseudoalteromonas sp. MMG005]MBQ4846650.1 hypothetical protein [Pseudoalteromonas sp. MMG005]